MRIFTSNNNNKIRMLLELLLKWLHKWI